MTGMGMDIDAVMQAAQAAVAQAGLIARRYFRTSMEVENKTGLGLFDPVTIADREVELALRAALAQITPGLGIVGEEFGASGDARDYWVIDPIDGTRAFMSGMPCWGILLGLVLDGRPAGGIMHQPFTGEMFCATAGRGSVLHHAGTTTPLRCSARTRLQDAVLYSTDPRPLAFAGLADGFAGLAQHCRLQRWGGDCYAFALLAQGSVDLVVDAMLQSYDIVPLIPIITEAGGIVTDIDGKPPMQGGHVIAAANAALHQAALQHLRGCAPSPQTTGP